MLQNLNHFPRSFLLSTCQLFTRFLRHSSSPLHRSIIWVLHLRISSGCIFISTPTVSTPRAPVYQEKSMYINSRVILFPSLYRISHHRNVVEVSGVYLSTFSEADWTKLQQLLNVSPEDYIFPGAQTAVRTGQDQYNARRLRHLMIA